MSRTARIEVTAADLGGDTEREPHDAVEAAIGRAWPGVTVSGIDPVDIELSLTDRDGECIVRWAVPTPDAAARHLYHESGRPAPYALELRVPDCLAAYLGHGPEPTDAA